MRLQRRSGRSQSDTTVSSDASATETVSLKEVQEFIDKLNADSNRPLRQEIITASRFVSSPKIVLDKDTGLMWMSDDFRTLEERFPQTWFEAMNWPKKINHEHYAGYGDWPVPTLAQYRTINKSREDRKTYEGVFPAQRGHRFLDKRPAIQMGCVGN